MKQFDPVLSSTFAHIYLNSFWKCLTERPKSELRGLRLWGTQSRQPVQLPWAQPVPGVILGGKSTLRTGRSSWVTSWLWASGNTSSLRAHWQSCDGLFTSSHLLSPPSMNWTSEPARCTLGSWGAQMDLLPAWWESGPAGRVQGHGAAAVMPSALWV